MLGRGEEAAGVEAKREWKKAAELDIEGKRLATLTTGQCTACSLIGFYFSVSHHQLESTANLQLSVHLYSRMGKSWGRWEAMGTPLKHSSLCLFWALSQLVK